VIFIVVKQPVRPEYADDWVELVDDFTTASWAEPGNICPEENACHFLVSST
jgi:hypothetical protein